MFDQLLAAIRQVPLRGDGPVPAETVAEEIAALSQAVSLLTARIAGRVGEVRARDGRPDGLSMSRWVAIKADVPEGEARALVGLADMMTAHPDTGEVFADGSLSRSRARILSRAAQAHSDLFERDEAMLVELAETMELPDLARAVRYWMGCADDELAGCGAERQRRLAHLHLSKTFAGMVRLDGFLDPETGEAVLAALDAATPPPVHGDTRPAANRRAEALGAVCEQWLRNGTVDGGLRAAVSLVVDLDTLEGRQGSRCELTHTGPVPPETARRILCDADVTRIVTRGESEILDVGRATRVPSPALRKALAIRDQHCRFLGCRRPSQWCDVHHVVHWADGGVTSLENCILLCRHHHTLMHRGVLAVVGNDVVYRKLVGTDLIDAERGPP